VHFDITYAYALKGACATDAPQVLRCISAIIALLGHSQEYNHVRRHVIRCDRATAFRVSRFRGCSPDAECWSISTIRVLPIPTAFRASELVTKTVVRTYLRCRTAAVHDATEC
jgi:hypothetical protein